MKTFSFTLMIVISLCATLCCPEEDDFGTSFFVENNNLILVENNETVFNLNDNITIETTINNTQTLLNGETILLSDLFYDDSFENAFLQYNLSLYKQTGFGTLSPIAIPNDAIIAETGEIELNNQFMTVRVFYDQSTNSFKSRFSINLRESGTFFLANSNFGFNDFSPILISGGVYELGFIEISTSIENSNSNGGYQFQVN